MLPVERWMDIHALRREGHSIKAIARLSGHSRNTVRRILRQAVREPFRTPARASALDSFKPYLEQRLAECSLSAVRLLEEIRPMGYSGSIDVLRRFVSGLRGEARRKARLTVRFETPPGKQAQVDWGYCGRFATPSGSALSVYAFVMVLAFSRMLYVAFTSSMKLPVLLACHLDAFRFFGGIVHEILYDNMKQVRLEAGKLNPLLLDFAQHHGFSITTHRPYRPRTKGKVERGVGYLKYNFLAGRSFVDLADVNAQGAAWRDSVANVRIHGTTGERPVDLFPREGLVPFSSVPLYRVADPVYRKVDAEGFVRFAQSRYSVPPALTGTQVALESQGGRILIRSGDAIVAEHGHAKRGATVSDPRHLADLWRLSLARTKTPPPSWRMTFDQAVETRPLAVYQGLVP